MGLLPEFLPPMLASIGKPFDSDEHVFEPKWDGIRALAFVEDGAVRLVNRNRRDITHLYPELAGLAGLPPGTIVDGELVCLVDGRPSFSTVMSREQASGEHRIRTLARSLPAAFPTFDLLYVAGRDLTDEPLALRRELLRDALATLADPRVTFSEGVVGAGRAAFEGAEKMGIEGIVAKRLASRYRPGRRTEDWIKIKCFQRLHCLILGYLADESGDVRSLVVASDSGSGLRHVGQVGSGLTDAMRARLRVLFEAAPRSEPLVPCGADGRWVEPGLYCTVSFLEWTKDEMLRAPVFVGLIDETSG